MGGDVGANALRALMGACALWTAQADAQSLLEHSAEARLQLDFVVPDAALRIFLPAGWEPNVATSGPAKDCNLRMVFVDRVDITKPDGSPASPGSSQLVYLAAPIRQTATGTLGQMLIFGLTADAKDAPGPFGVYVPASDHRMTRTTVAQGGTPARTEEDWAFAAPSGERMEVRVKYERAAARKTVQETIFFSALNPTSSQTLKIEQGLDIMRNATVPMRDRVSEFQYKAAGGKIAPLFDGSERVVSIDALHWHNRAVLAP